MKLGEKVLSAGLLTAFLVSGSFALYYKERFANSRRELDAAIAQLALQGAATSTPGAAPSLLHRDGSGTWSQEGRGVQRHGTIGERTSDKTPDANFEPTSDEGVELEPQSDMIGENTDWLEVLKRTDPDKYKVMLQRYQDAKQRRQRAKERILESWNNATNYFANRQTSAMSTEQLAEYRKLMDLMGETWALKQALQENASKMTDRREAGATVQSNMVVLARMLDAERNREYYDLAMAMGLGEADAAKMVDYINQIASNTSVNVIFADTTTRGGGRGGRGGKTH